MNKPNLFGLNLYIEDIRYLKESLQSIVADENTFKVDVQLILFDTICDDHTSHLCQLYQQKFPENITCIEMRDASIAECYNKALALNSSLYLNFINSSTIFGHQTFAQIKKFLHHDHTGLFAMHTKFFDSDKGIKDSVKNKQSKYNLKENLFYLPLFMERYFISKDIIADMVFRDELHEDCTKEVLLRCLKCQEEVTIVKKTCIYYCNAQERSLLRFPYQTMRWWYLDQMRDLIIPHLKELHEEGAIPIHMQALLLYLIEIKFYFNRNMRYKYIIRKDEVDIFYELVQHALSYIDSEVILKNSVRKIAPAYFCFQLIRIKNNQGNLLPEIKQADDGQDRKSVV